MAKVIGATLRASERLRLTKPILAILRRGTWARSLTVAMGILPNQLPTNRLAIRVRRGVVRGGAQRNRVKRLVREAYRRHKEQLVAGWDLLVIVTRQGHAPPWSLGAVEQELETLCRKLGLLSSPPPPSD